MHERRAPLCGYERLVRRADERLAADGSYDRTVGQHDDELSLKLRTDPGS